MDFMGASLDSRGDEIVFGNDTRSAETRADKSVEIRADDCKSAETLSVEGREATSAEGLGMDWERAVSVDWRGSERDDSLMDFAGES